MRPHSGGGRSRASAEMTSQDQQQQQVVQNGSVLVALVRDGDTVILDENSGERLSMVKLKASASVRVGRGAVPGHELVGQPYGAVLTLSSDGQHLQRMEECPVGEWAQGQVDAVDKDNAELFDRNAENQTLSADDIAAMKQAGKDGKEIIDALITNSKTFQNKTQFSQEKYKRKKAKKYLTVVTVRRPTGRYISQVYYDKGPERVHNLRPDSLAIMLSLANVGAGQQVLVVDGCVGVVVAAVAERLGEHGTTLAAHVENPTSLEAAKALNLTRAQLAAIQAASLRQLLELHEEARAQWHQGHQPQEPAAGAATMPQQAAAAQDAEPAAEAAEQSEQQPPEAPAAAPAVPQAQLERQKVQAAKALLAKQRLDVLRGLVRRGFGSCVVAAPKYDPLALMEQVMPLLRNSAPFAVFSPWPQPLAECMMHLQATKQAVMLQLQESWLRPYQVLPLRTHPNMMCAGTGGFILSGIKVVVAPAPAPAPGAAAPGASTDAAAAAGGPGSDSNASKRAKR